MRILKTKLFQRWAKDIGLEDSHLTMAIKELQQGLVEASLGGCIYKKRIGIDHRGKSSGARTLIAFKIENKAFFLYGFAKNQKVNISEKEREELKAYAKLLFGLNETQVKHALQAGQFLLLKVLYH